MRLGHAVTSAQGGATQPYLSQPLPCTHLADLISFNSMQESLKIKKCRARAVMPKRQQGRDTRGPSAPKHELRTPPCEEKLLQALLPAWHGKKEIRGGRKERKCVDVILSELHSSSLQVGC